MATERLLQEKDEEIERLKAEIRRLKDEYATLVENAPETVFELDVNGNFTYFNKMVEEKLGYRREDLLGKSFTRLLVPERVLVDVRALEKVLCGKPVYGYRTAVVDAKGKHLLIEISAKPLKAAGKIVGIHGIARTLEEMPLLAKRPEWPRLRAVREGRVYVVDGNAYFHRPGPRLVESLEILAEILWPAEFRLGHSGTGFVGTRAA